MIIQSDHYVKPVLSVVIATYNQVKYIEQTVLSALNQQTTFPFEVVVGDDGSNDGTRELLKELQIKHPENLKLVFNDKNLMVTRNYVNAIREASGKYVATLDGDDYYVREDALQRFYDYLESHKDCALVHAGFYRFQDSTGKRLNECSEWKSRMLQTKGTESVLSFLKDDYTEYPLGSATCFIRSIYVAGCDKYPGIIEKSAYFGEGTLLNVIMALEGKFGYISEIFAAYRVLDKSLSHFETKAREFKFWKDYTEIKVYTAMAVGLNQSEINEVLVYMTNKLRKYAIILNQVPSYKDCLSQLKTYSDDKCYQESIDSMLGFFPTISTRLLSLVYPVYRLLRFKK